MAGAAPVKINTTSGAGVPGGFSASNLKSPATETAKLTNTSKAIATRKANLQAAIKAGVPGISNDDIKKLDAMDAANSAKLKTASKVPDFSTNTSAVAPPAVPSVPDFKAIGIPDVPPGVPGTVPEVTEISTPSGVAPVSTPGATTGEVTVNADGSVSVEAPEAPAPPPPTASERADAAAAKADGYALAIDKTTNKKLHNQATKYANQAKKKAKEAKNQTAKANEFLTQAETYDNQAKDEENTAVKTSLTARGDTFRKKAEPHQAKAVQAADDAESFMVLAKASFDEAQLTVAG